MVGVLGASNLCGNEATEVNLGARVRIVFLAQNEGVVFRQSVYAARYLHETNMNLQCALRDANKKTCSFGAPSKTALFVLFWKSTTRCVLTCYVFLVQIKCLFT